MSTKVRPPLPRIEPIVPKLRHQPFNDPAWLFGPKYDGWRGMVYLTRKGCTIYSKRQNALARFDDLRKRAVGGQAPSPPAVPGRAGD